MKDLYLSAVYIVFSFLSVSWAMLAEGAEVTRAGGGLSQFGLLLLQ